MGEIMLPIKVINTILFIVLNMLLSAPAIFSNTIDSYYFLDLIAFTISITIYLYLKYPDFNLINHVTRRYLYKTKKIYLPYDKFLMFLLLQILIVRIIGDFTIVEITESIVIVLLLFLCYQFLYLQTNFKNQSVIELFFTFITVVWVMYSVLDYVIQKTGLQTGLLTLINLGLITFIIALITFLHNKHNGVKLIDLESN
jgi:hypothetical protein